MTTADDPRPDTVLTATRLLPRRRERTWIRRVLVFVAIVVAADALIGERSLAQSMRARRELTRAVEEVDAIRFENGRLRERIRRLKDDPRAVESLARGELGLVRRGEILVVVKTAAPSR